ncbi:MAG: hypothetical protein IKR17_06940 [Bacteroidales bacterium]|nr:hypothetical protein [Bacteroidales bacterium]
MVILCKAATMVLLIYFVLAFQASAAQPLTMTIKTNGMNVKQAPMQGVILEMTCGCYMQKIRILPTDS